MVASAVPRILAAAALAAGAAGLPLAGAAQDVAPVYRLTHPTLPQLDPELSPRVDLFSLGPVRFASAGSTTGAGLSFEAGQRWFARVGIGRSLDTDLLSVGGGYRFAGGDSLSMHVTRQLGHERLGLAVRYDWASAYLRLSYEPPLAGLLRGPDVLRFSAGLRF